MTAGAVRPAESYGPFRLVREIGRGGMATVFLGERTDGQFEQRVAIKLVQQRWGDGQAPIVRRFLAERRILARLEHPGIARLLDGGIAPDGTPWFAMEYVDGERLDRWCDAQRAPISRRLELFRAVCEAVQDAHQHLIVHRDIKPSNILVTQDGVPKLLDFGIAKVMETPDDDTNGELTVTRAASMAMTPQYAAPEQVRGEAISAATDVYALGALLYELLTGVRPYEVNAKSAVEIERVVCEVNPPAPSTTFTLPRAAGHPDRAQRAAARGTTPERLARRLRGDLDAIVLQALRKEPRRRYPSAAALLDDLRRLESGLPVRARPDTLGYRTWRFVTRNRAGIAGVATFAAALVGGFLRERTLRERAEAETRRAGAVEEYMVSVFDVADPLAVSPVSGADVTARALLERGETRISRELAAQPDVQARLRSVLARVYTNLGLPDRAVTLARTALQQQSALGKDRPETAAAMAQLGEALGAQNQYEEGAPLLRQALVMEQQLLGPEAPATQLTRARLATLLQDMGNLPEADTLFRVVLAARRRQVPPDTLRLTKALNDLAVLLYIRGRYNDAEPLYREALAFSMRTPGENHPSTAMTLQNLAQVQQLRGQLDEAEALFRRALQAKRRVLGNGHPSVTLSMNNLGSFLVRDRGKVVEAESLIRAAITLDRQTFGDRHGYVAAGLGNLANAARTDGRLDEAVRYGREAVSIAREVYPGPNKETAAYLSGLGASLFLSGRVEEATSILQECVAMYREALGDSHLFTQTVRISLARVLMERGDVRGAEPLFRAAATLDTANAGNRMVLAAAAVGLGQVRLAGGDASGAADDLERALERMSAVAGERNWRTAEAQIALARARLALGERAPARAILRSAVGILEPLAASQPRLLAAARNALKAAER